MPAKKILMPGLVPGIHGLNCVFVALKAWMAGVKPGQDRRDDHGLLELSFIPARAAACSTYFWVCSNAPCSAFAVDMSLISAKCAAIASGVQSDWAD